MNANQQVSEIIKRHELLDEGDLLTLKLAVDDLEQVVPSCYHCGECGKDWSETAIINLELPSSDRDKLKILFRKLRDMVEGVPDKGTVFSQRWEQERQ